MTKTTASVRNNPMGTMFAKCPPGKLTGGVFSKICQALATLTDTLKPATGLAMLVLTLSLAAAAVALTSCTDEVAALNAGEGMTVELNIQTKSVSDITSTKEEYIKGTQWENYIDIDGGDYRIYFFTYTTDPDTNNRLITEFTPLEVTVDEGSVYTKYTLMGRIDGEIAKYSDFKVVILANWGSDVYPTNLVTLSEDADNATTIDDICNAETAVFDAFVGSDGTAVLPSETLRVPFYGVREYTGVTWSSMWRTVLNGDITLLRALAKVVVQLTNTEDDNLTVTEMNLCGYNATGYCAPKNVYLRSDYDHDYEWSQDFVETLHLVNTDAGGNEANDSNASTRKLAFLKIADCDDAAGTLDTWVAYVPEFDNTGTDYSYIEVLFDHQLTGDSGTGDPTPYIIYFGNYDSDGACSAYESTDNSGRFDIHRNYLYSFVTTYAMGTLIVDIAEWGEVFENEWTFGETKHIIYYSDDDDAGQFTPYDDGVVYKSMVNHPDDDPDKEADEDNLTVYIQKVPASVLETGGTFYIYEQIEYLGYYYKVIGIGDLCFEAETNLITVDISQYIEYIGANAFHGCDNLETINCRPTTPPTCHEEAFRDEHTESIFLYVPEGSLDLYKAADVWKDFVNIDERNFGD